jgi:tape measure domain-containing protein
MAEFNVGLKLSLEDAQKFQSGLSAVATGINQIRDALARGIGSVNVGNVGANIKKEFDQGTQAVRTMGGEVDRLRGLIGTLVGGLTLVGLARSVTGAALELDRINNSLAVVTGSSAAAEREFAFVRAEADRLGVSLAESAKSYVGLTAAAKGTALEGEATRKIYSSIVESMSRLGRSSAQTEGALLAVQQIISKGQVSAEELRGQLGERLPGAFQIAARAMNVTTAELGKMLEQGLVPAVDFLPKFAAELQKSFNLGGRVETAQAQIERFKTALFDAASAFAKSGFLDSVVQGVTALSAALKDQGVQQGLRTLGALIGDVLKFTLAFSREIATVVVAIGGFKLLQGAATSIASFAGASDDAAKSIGRLRALAGPAVVLTIAVVGIELLDKLAAKIADIALENRALTESELARIPVLQQQIAKLGEVIAAEESARSTRLLSASEVQRLSTGQAAAYAGELSALKQLEADELRRFVRQQELIELQLQQARTTGASAAAIGALEGQLGAVNVNIQTFSASLQRVNGALETLRTGVAATNEQLRTGLSVGALEAVRSFDAMTAAGKSTAEALKNIFKGFDPNDFQSIQTAIGALGQLQNQGKLAADVIQKELGKALSDLSGQDLLRFQIQARAAFEGAAATATQFGIAVKAASDAAIKQLGIDVSAVETRVATSFKNMSAAVNVLANDAKISGQVVAAAFAKLIDSAATKKEIDEVAAEFGRLRTEGRITGENVAESLDLINRKQREIAANVSGELGRAIADLGVKTAEQLRLAAEQMKASFDVAIRSGQLSVDQQLAALDRYITAYKAANNGVVSDELRIQREILQARLNSIQGAQAANKAATNEIVADAARAASAVRSIGRSYDEVAAAAASAAQVEREAAEQRQAGLQAFGGLIGNIINGVNQLSAAAANAFGVSPRATSSVDEYRASLKKVQEEIEFNKTRFYQPGIDALVQFNDRANQIKATFLQQAIAAEEMKVSVEQATASGTSGLRNMANQSIDVTGRFNLMDQQQLSGLKSAIDSARARVQQLDDQIRGTIQTMRGMGDSLNEELLRAKGQLQEIERLRAAQQRSQLEQQLRSVTADPNATTEQKRAAQDEFNRTSNLLSQVSGIKIANAAKEEADARARSEQLHKEELARIAQQSAARRAANDAVISTATPAPITQQITQVSAPVAAATGGAVGNQAVTFDVKIDAQSLLTPDAMRRTFLPLYNNFVRATG